MNVLSSLRARVVALAIAAALPGMVLFVADTVEEHHAGDAAARESVASLARHAARQHRETVSGARFTLAALARIVPDLRHDPERCGRFLAGVLGEAGGAYHSLGVYDAGGTLVCNAIPWKGVVTALDRRYFFDAVASGDFAIGEYQVGRVTGLKGLNLGFPMRDAQGVVTGVVFIALNIERLNLSASEMPLPRKGLLTLVDRTGTILSRHPSDEARIGQKLRTPAVIEAVSRDEDGVFEAAGEDGEERLFAVETVAMSPDGVPALRAMVSIPTRVIYEEANLRLARYMAALLLAALLAVALAWYGTEVLVLRGLKRLVAGASGINAGDLSARVGLERGARELLELGRTFDAMADALQQRDQALSEALRSSQTQATTDALTGLLNRRYLDEFLPRELARAARQKGGVAALMLDLDHFKRFNDSFGHEAGDLVLRELGALLRSLLRSSDVACRYGGEEIVVLLLDVSGQGALDKAEEIRAAIERQALSHRGRELGTVTASLGLAVFPQDGADAPALLKAADDALYRAKRNGRNRVEAAAGPAAAAA